jgi:cystathionine beta-lyase/cystathionine gamma-synthase
VYTLPDLDALDRIMNAEAPGFIYFRDGHPNAKQLADQLAALEGATWGVACVSGMAAVAAAVLAHVQQGERIVASNRLYGKTTALFNTELARFGVQTTLVDSGDLAQVRNALATPAKLLWVEMLSNPLLRMVDLEALAEICRERECLFMVDNTFATPVLTRPLDHGADLVMESLTKMIGGHADVMLGVLCGRGDRLSQIAPLVSTWGLMANPFDCWLAMRGLPTLALRMRAASANAAALADWLAEQRGVSRVIYPGRPDHPDHALARRYLAGGFGNMLCFELEGGREAVNRFLRSAPAIPFSPSLGNATTTCSHPGTTSHRYVSPAEKKRQGIGDGLIRLSVGVEDVEQIKKEIAAGL